LLQDHCGISHEYQLCRVAAYCPQNRQSRAELER